MFSNRTIIIGLYIISLLSSLLLVVISTDLFCRRQSTINPQILNKYSKYIRVTGIIFFIVPTAFFVQYIQNYNSSQTIPDLQIEFINNGSNEIHIYGQGKFILTEFKTPLTDQQVASGKIKLKTADNNYQNEFIISPKGKLIVYAQVINPVGYLHLFQRGDINTWLIFNQADGKMITVQGIPFDRETFSNYCIPFEIGNTHEDSNTSIL